MKKIETFEHKSTTVLTFISLEDGWSYLKNCYPKWYQLYLIQVTAQMTDLMKEDYLMAIDKNEFTKDRWLKHLTGDGLSF